MIYIVCIKIENNTLMSLTRDFVCQHMCTHVHSDNKKIIKEYHTLKINMYNVLPYTFIIIN